MKNTHLLRLCLGASVVFASQLVYADPGNGQERKSARAMQIQIDKETGKKITPNQSQSDQQVATAAAPSTVTSDASSILPARSLAPVHHADGTVSAQLGEEHMKYLVMTVDKNGKKTMSHQSSKSIDSGVIHAQEHVEEK